MSSTTTQGHLRRPRHSRHDAHSQTHTLYKQNKKRANRVPFPSLVRTFSQPACGLLSPPEQSSASPAKPLRAFSPRQGGVWRACAGSREAQARVHSLYLRSPLTSQHSLDAISPDLRTQKPTFLPGFNCNYLSSYAANLISENYLKVRHHDK